MVPYLTGARLATLTRRERLCELGGLESLPKPSTRLDTQLHPVVDPSLDPGVGFSLEYECSVTQSPPGRYFYFKGETVGRFFEPSQAKAKGRKWKPWSGT